METATERLNAWRKALGAISSVEARAQAFENAANDISAYIARGLDKAEAADWLHDLATAHGLFEVYNEDDIQAVIADAVERSDELERVPDIKPNWVSDSGEPINRKTNGKHAPEIIIEPTAYVLPDPATISPRAWIYGTHYMRGVVTATVAPGGFGKTTLALFEALWMVDHDYRIWYISGEDDKPELDRRIAAHCQKHNPQPLDGRLFVDDKLSFPFKIAKSSRNGTEFDNERLIAFEAAIARRKIDVVIIDPFVSFHLLSENDTAAMDALVKRLGEICVRCQCCIEISHHVRKPVAGQFEITVYDARGAAAIVNAVRSCRVLNQMSPIEAQQVQKPPETRFAYVRIDSGKRNMAPPEKARWLHLTTVWIANGDAVQALEPFEFKPQSATELDKEWLRSVMEGREFRADSRSPEWLGHELAQRFGRDAENKGDIKWINGVLRKWLAEKLICKVTREDEHRHTRTFFHLIEESKDS